MIRHLRFHGRGGEGVKLACRIVSRAAFLSGLSVQDSPLYGAERRGAPVVAFARFSDRPILERGYIDRPDAIVVMDQTLLGHPEAAVLSGLTEATLLLINGNAQTAHAIEGAGQANVKHLDVSSIALELLGQRLLSAPMAGFVTKATAVASWEHLAAAVRLELQDIGVAAELLERNVSATRRAFDATSAVGLRPPPAAHGVPVGGAVTAFVLPHLPARLAAPVVDDAANGAQRRTEGWRVYRPVIDLHGCTRCFICFALCPEGAIHLDAEHYPIVDYPHCKGCLVCVSECPPQVIHEVREETA